MIKLYGLDEWYAKVPKEKLIEDIDIHFGLLDKIPNTEEIRFVLKHIENAEYLNENRFRDRFGGELYISELSTGSKCVILATLIKDKIINFIEAGQNAYEALILLNADCTILVPQVDWLHYIYNVSGIQLPGNIEIEVVGDKVYHSISEYNEGVGA